MNYQKNNKNKLRKKMILKGISCFLVMSYIISSPMIILGKTTKNSSDEKKGIISAVTNKCWNLLKNHPITTGFVGLTIYLLCISDKTKKHLIEDYFNPSVKYVSKTVDNILHPQKEKTFEEQINELKIQLQNENIVTDEEKALQDRILLRIERLRESFNRQQGLSIFQNRTQEEEETLQALREEIGKQKSDIVKDLIKMENISGYSDIRHGISKRQAVELVGKYHNLDTNILSVQEKEMILNNEFFIFDSRCYPKSHIRNCIRLEKLAEIERDVEERQLSIEVLDREAAHTQKLKNSGEIEAKELAKRMVYYYYHINISDLPDEQVNTELAKYFYVERIEDKYEYYPKQDLRTRIQIERVNHEVIEGRPTAGVPTDSRNVFIDSSGSYQSPCLSDAAEIERLDMIKKESLDAFEECVNQLRLSRQNILSSDPFGDFRELDKEVDEYLLYDNRGVRCIASPKFLARLKWMKGSFLYFDIAKLWGKGHKDYQFKHIKLFPEQDTNS